MCRIITCDCNDIIGKTVTCKEWKIRGIIDTYPVVSCSDVKRKDSNQFCSSRF